MEKDGEGGSFDEETEDSEDADETEEVCYVLGFFGILGFLGILMKAFILVLRQAQDLRPAVTLPHLICVRFF